MDKPTKDDDQPKSRVVPVDERINDLKVDSKAMSPKEKLSAYFTIAAAAFGLISDGCGSFFADYCWSSLTTHDLPTTVRPE